MDANNMLRQAWPISIAAPMNVVWNQLVKTDEVLPHLFGAVCQTETGLEVSRPLRMVSKDGRYVIAFGEVLDLTYPTRFSHSINFAMAPDEHPGITTYELEEVPGGTQVTLISEVTPGTKTAKMGNSGKFIVDNLKAQIETGKPNFGGRMVVAISPLTALLAPSSCRTINWPFSRIPTGVITSRDSGNS
jgi:hypothetical protein